MKRFMDMIRLSFNTVYYAVATNKMGRKGDAMAVVDSKGRVYGVERLRVVDVSIFPFLLLGHLMSLVCKSTWLLSRLPQSGHPTEKARYLLTRRHEMHWPRRLRTVSEMVKRSIMMGRRRLFHLPSRL